MNAPLSAASILAVASLGVLASASRSEAATLDFEGLACQTQFDVYAGFTFSSNWVTQCDDDYAGTWLNSAGAPSGATGAGNTYFGDPSEGVTIARATPFNLVGGMASSFLVSDDFDFVTPLSSANLVIEGYLDTMFVGSITVNFDPANGAAGPGYAPIGGALMGVDELRFFSSFDQQLTGGPDYWLVDDLELTDAAADPVPEPATMGLLGSGIAALAVRARRGRRHRRRRDS
jgi:hypothetical protein